jgi:hypothetical protein
MSFLDCMSCGFGAVILFFMIINAQVKETTEDDPTNLMAETKRLEVEILEGRKNLVLAKNTKETLESESHSTIPRRSPRSSASRPCRAISRRSRRK